MITNQPHVGRTAIELLLAEQRLTLDEMLRLRAALDQQPGGLAQTRPLIAPPGLQSERQSHTSIQRTSSVTS